MSSRRAIRTVSQRHAISTAIEGLEGRRLFTGVYAPIASTPFEQTWSPTTQITTNNDWAGVPSIIGYRGETLANSGTNVRDPSTILGDLSGTPANSVYVLANQTNGATNTGGVTEFELANPTIGLVGAGSATAPNIVIHIDATGVPNVRVQYTLRDLETGADNAAQPVALQYRIGNSGNFINVPAAYIADATGGPSVAGPDIPVDVTLAGIGNVPNLQLRILTADQAGNDENVGVDDIKVSAGVASPGALALTSATLSTAENAGTYNVVINRTGGAAGAATVDYVIAAGTASTPGDFSGTLTGTINFADGQITAQIPVTIAQDALVEGNETFTVTLSNATGATLGTPASATVTIVDDESAGDLSFSASSYSPGESAGVYNIPINRTGTSVGAVTVDYTITLGSASNPGDFTGPLTGTISFASGEVLKFVPITIVQDALVEGTETFTIALSNPTGGAQLIAPSSTTVNIIDDENPGMFALSSATAIINENAGTVTLTVNRTGGTAGPVTLTYATANGTATSGSDYTGTTSGSVSFIDGQTSATFTIPINNDTLVESDETFTVTISAPTAGTLGSPTSATVTIADNDAPGSFSFLPTTYSFGENVGLATFTVVRTGGTNGAVTVDYATLAGTALSPDDFTATSGTLSFANGQDTATFTVAIANDSLAELTESFSVSLNNATGGATIGTATAWASIVDDDTVIPTGLFINEIFADPASSPNTPKQFAEIRGTPGASLDNVYLLQIEGDGDQLPGTIDFRLDLTGRTLGSNGLLLITATTNGWTPQDPNTAVFSTSMLDTTAIGFETSSYSFVLVYRNPAGDPVPALSADLDSDNTKDANGLGTLELPSNLTLLDGVGTTDNGATDIRYVASLPALAAGGSADAIVRINNALGDPNAFYYGTNGGGTNNTSLAFNANANQRSANFPVGVGIVTPGAANAGASVAPPTVVSTVFNAKAGQKVVVSFSEDVSNSIQASDFTLTRNGGGAPGLSLVVSSISADGKTVTLTFANTGGVNGGVVLQDGAYTFTTLGGQVASDASGVTLASDVTSNFQFLNADFDVSGTVEFNDLVKLAQNYGTTSGATFENGDATYDGQVNFDDLVLLAQKYGSSAAVAAMLAAYTPAPVAPPVGVVKGKNGTVVGNAIEVVVMPAVKTTALGTKKVIR